MIPTKDQNIMYRGISAKHYFGILAVVMIAFAFGIWFWLRTNTPGSQGGDAYQYNRLAITLLEQGVLNYSGETIVVPPIYPMFLALIYFLVGEPNFIVASIANVALFAIIAGIVTWASMRFVGLGAGYFAGLLVIINHDLLFWSPFALSEMLNIIFFVLFALSLKIFAMKSQVKWVVTAGVFAALANLTHASLMIYLPAVMIWFLVCTPGKLAQRLLYMVIFSLVVLILVVPWSIWISSNRDATVPVANYGFLTLHHGNNPEYYLNLREYLFGDSVSPVSADYYLPVLSDDLRIQEIWQFISQSPLDWLQLYFLKLYYHLQFFNMKDIPSIKIAIWSTAYWLLVWPLTILYLVKNRFIWRDVFVWLVLTNLCVYPLIHISRYHRYRTPIEPLLVLLAAGGFSLLLPYILKCTSPMWEKVRVALRR